MNSGLGLTEYSIIMKPRYSTSILPNLNFSFLVECDPPGIAMRQVLARPPKVLRQGLVPKECVIHALFPLIEILYDLVIPGRVGIPCCQESLG